MTVETLLYLKKEEKDCIKPKWYKTEKFGLDSGGSKEHSSFQLSNDFRRTFTGTLSNFPPYQWKKSNYQQYLDYSNFSVNVSFC